MNSPHRIIDANGNRAREALRVMEEAARFIVESPAVAGELKQLRHDLSQALAANTELIHHRDTPGDIGTTLSTPAEQQRDSVRSVVQASAARLSEALRAIEEYAKTLHTTEGQQLAVFAEQARYRGYDLAQRLTRALADQAPQWRLCLLLTQSLCTHLAWQDVLEQAICAGVDAVQVREKAMDSAPLLEHIKQVITLVNKRAAVIVNDRLDLAMLAGADGVHFGQDDLNPAQARKLAGDAMIVGVSTANLEQARHARELGASYCGVGPMFHTTTKHKPVLAGPSYLAEYLAWGGLPHLAIGGITPGNIAELAAVGCRGVAVSSAVCSAKDPGQAAATLCQALDTSQAQASGVVSQPGTNRTG